LQLFLTSTNPNSNVVRVAPRPKNPNYLHTTNTQTSALNNNPPAQPNANFPINCFNYINYQPPTVSQISSMKQQQQQQQQHHDKSGLLSSQNPFGQKQSAASRAGKNATNGMNNDVKFNSLKSLITKKSPHFYSIKANKCKRHHSFIDPQHTIYDNSREFNSINLLQQNDLKAKNYEQPMYENLTDSIQIRESPQQTESSFALVLAEFGNNGQPEDIFYERTIHRSDSGISNSSYDCITPTPAPRVSSSSSGSHIIKTPVYMNLPFLSSSSSSNAFYGIRTNGKMSGKSKLHSNSNIAEHEVC
jgi:hypothetical protein